jgi:hypothetical protein
MCFNIDYYRQQAPYVAEEDIKCYKILKARGKPAKLLSSIMNFEYELGKNYKIGQIFKQSLKRGREITRGYHSYVMIDRIPNRCIRSIEEASSDWCGYEIAVHCTIPKGSLYWMNSSEYCSNQIRIDKIMYNE